MKDMLFVNIFQAFFLSKTIDRWSAPQVRHSVQNLNNIPIRLNTCDFKASLKIIGLNTCICSKDNTGLVQWWDRCIEEFFLNHDHIYTHRFLNVAWPMSKDISGIQITRTRNARLGGKGIPTDVKASSPTCFKLTKEIWLKFLQLKKVYIYMYINL